MDDLVKYLCGRAAQQPKIERVLLFGSRARGEGSERSDYDIAVVAPSMEAAEWSEWAVETREGAPTLCGLDLVQFESVESESLRQKIESEGRVLYERSHSKQ